MRTLGLMFLTLLLGISIVLLAMGIGIITSLTLTPSDADTLTGIANAYALAITAYSLILAKIILYCRGKISFTAIFLLFGVTPLCFSLLIDLLDTSGTVALCFLIALPFAYQTLAIAHKRRHAPATIS